MSERKANLARWRAAGLCLSCGGEVTRPALDGGYCPRCGEEMVRRYKGRNRMIYLSGQRYARRGNPRSPHTPARIRALLHRLRHRLSNPWIGPLTGARADDLSRRCLRLRDTIRQGRRGLLPGDPRATEGAEIQAFAVDLAQAYTDYARRARRREAS